MVQRVKALACLQVPRPHIRVTSILGMPLEGKRKGKEASHFTLTQKRKPHLKQGGKVKNDTWRLSSA